MFALLVSNPHVVDEVVAEIISSFFLILHHPALSLQLVD